MKKILCLLLIAGCSNVEYSNKNVSTIAQSMDAFYFSDIFMDAPEVNIEQQIQKLSKEYTWEYKTNVFENSFTCEYCRKSGGGGYVTCEYLGNWRGQDMVARHYMSGGTGRFSDIVFCSLEDGKLRVHKTILLGDRAIDGMLLHPIYDGEGKIYFYMHLSNDTLLKEAGLDEKTVPLNELGCYQCYGIVGKCVYDIGKEKIKVLSMIAFSDDNQNTKIQLQIREKMHSGIAIFSEKETQTFLERLRKMYSPV